MVSVWLGPISGYAAREGPVQGLGERVYVRQFGEMPAKLPQIGETPPPQSKYPYLSDSFSTTSRLLALIYFLRMAGVVWPVTFMIS